MSPSFRSPRVLVPLALAALVAVVAVIVVVGVVVGRWVHEITARPPAVGTTFIAPDISEAARAASDDDATDAERAAAAFLASQPTAYWLTPERHPAGEVGETVGALAAQARDERAAFAVVVYGLPGRDCGGHSTGGLDPDAYADWVGEIGAALDTARDVQKVVVLEPDGLALAPECGLVEERTALLRDAVGALQSPGTWIYLDGGHSDWLGPERMAELISAVDVAGQVRGFATNVSNYQAIADEFAYAHELSDLLDGMHAVVDTSRSGAGTAPADWCNPPGQRVGEVSGEYGDDVVDANLWLKPPGESDGPCHGGPEAGAWWADAAVALTEGAR
ncbi:glycoside hydrolase family 6 protein [Microbacterium gilvum]|uniref:Glucanase n=1 Tax=Microbacterium gilvum TaxID=1336204 RepID=A0ABP9AAC0_9MICO